MVFSKEKDRSHQICIDYRGLNKITRKYCYPILCIDELLDQLNKVYIFTKLNLRSGYNLIHLCEGGEYKMAFCTRYGSFKFMVLPFGLTNALATFQHFMNNIFCQYLDDFLGGYLNDLIIYTMLEDGVIPPSFSCKDNP